MSKVIYSSLAHIVQYRFLPIWTSKSKWFREILSYLENSFVFWFSNERNGNFLLINFSFISILEYDLSFQSPESFSNITCRNWGALIVDLLVAAFTLSRPGRVGFAVKLGRFRTDERMDDRDGVTLLDSTLVLLFTSDDSCESSRDSPNWILLWYRLTTLYDEYSRAYKKDTHGNKKVLWSTIPCYNRHASLMISNSFAFFGFKRVILIFSLN